MAIGLVIELASLPARHPKPGTSLLKRWGAAAVLRLSRDPTDVPKGTTTREVTVDRLSPATGGAQREEIRAITWSGKTGVTEDDLVRLPVTCNENQITEEAALAIMALLIHELEELAIETVLPIGSGADYLVAMSNGEQAAPVEVSGIREDESGGRASQRLTEKCGQMLARCPAGFVSVTTFKRLKAGIMHSYLHYVTAQSNKRGKRRGRGRK